MNERPEYRPKIELPLNQAISEAVDEFEPLLVRIMRNSSDKKIFDAQNELIYRIESKLNKQLPGNLRERVANVLRSTITTSTIIEGETLKTDVCLQDLKGKLERTLQELDTSGT